MGFIFDPAQEAAGPAAPAGDHERAPSGGWNTPCPSRWSRWSTTSPSTSTAPMRDLLTGARRADAAGLLRADRAALLRSSRDRACCRLPQRAELDRFGAACRNGAGAVRHGRRTSSTACCPLGGKSDGQGTQPGMRCSSDHGFDRAAARADSRRLAQRAHRPGAESPARQQHRSRMSRPATSSTRQRLPSRHRAIWA